MSVLRTSCRNVSCTRLWLASDDEEFCSSPRHERRNNNDLAGKVDGMIMKCLARHWLDITRLTSSKRQASSQTSVYIAIAHSRKVCCTLKLTVAPLFFI